jgi:hypothetical protein
MHGGGGRRAGEHGFVSTASPEKDQGVLGAYVSTGLSLLRCKRNKPPGTLLTPPTRGEKWRLLSAARELFGTALGVGR